MSGSGAKQVINDVLADCGVLVGKDEDADMVIHDERFYERILTDGSLGLGESYMDGWWDAPHLDDVICRLLHHRASDRVRGHAKARIYYLRSRLLNLQAPSRAFDVGEKHYDIGNDLYRAMLGDSMAYTCAYWRNADTLDAAQNAKFDLVCRKTGLREGMRVLELGCGWGTFARYAATHYGVFVTGYTVSKAQAAFGREINADLPVDIRLDDYRNAEGEYDAVVSIGLMEHIGYKNYRGYMELAQRCLRPDGIAFVHTIGGIRSSTAIEPWLGQYIFPNAMLPSIAQLGRAMEGLFVLEDLHNIGPDYDHTLMAWHRNAEAAWETLGDRYDARFRRMWRYYLLACAGGFRCRYNQLWQLVMTRECDGRAQPDCRCS